MNHPRFALLPLALLAAGCVAPNAALSAEASVEQRLQALEQRWDRMEAQLAELHALLAARPAPADAAVQTVRGEVQGLRSELTTLQDEVVRQGHAVEAEAATRSREIAISTYGQINAIGGGTRNSLIDAESFELVFSGQPHDRISFFSELEFERAASVGADRGGEVLVEQAYVDYAWSDALALRAGVILVPFGNNEADHYAPLRDVIARPLSSRLIAPSDWTDNGFGLVGHRALNDAWQLDWEAYVIAGLGGEPGGPGLRSLRQGFGADNNQNKALVTHLALRQGDTLSVGLGLYQGAFDDRGDLDLRGAGLDFIWYPAPWKLSGEFLQMRADRIDGSSAALYGGYLRAGYDLDTLLPPGWAGEAFPDPKLALVYEYDYLSAEDLTDVLSLAQRERKHVLGLRWQPDHSWILKLNREWSQANAGRLVNGDDDLWLLGIGFVF